MAEKDYLAKLTVDPEKDKLDHGVMGMKWGQSRSSAELRTAAATRKSVAARSSATKVPTTTTSAHPSSTEHYAKLLAQVKAGKAGQMNEPDLKFFNSRTEALAKVAKFRETKPGWLSATTKKVALTTTENLMQSVSSEMGKKYVGGPILEKLMGTPATVSKPRVPGMTVEQSRQFFRDHPLPSPRSPTPSPQLVNLFKDLEDAGVLPK